MRAGSVSVLEHDELGLEEGVAVDGEPDARVALDAAEAGAAGDGGVLDVGSGHDGLVAADAQGDAGEGGRARVGVAALGAVVFGARDLGVVGTHDGAGQVEQRGAGVGDGVDGAGDEGAAADRIAVSAELPEAVGGFHADIGDGPSILAAVNVSKVVRSWGTLLQIRSEQRCRKRAPHIVIKGELPIRSDRVEHVESKTHKTVVVGVFLKLCTHTLCTFNSLRGRCCRAYFDHVLVNIARCTTSIPVINRPRFSTEKLGGG